MLSEALKKEIQASYSRFLEAKALRPRYGQKLMIAEIAKTLGGITFDAEGVRETDNHICVVEAGTGTGKTVAYLLATLCVAKALEKKVVLATATIALQEQVVYKDIPELLRYCELDFQFRLAKGRGRYLCLSKLDKILSHGEDASFIPIYEDEQGEINEADIALYQSMIEQLAQGKWDGDRDSLEQEIEQRAWQRVTTDHRQCTGRKCSHVSNCAFFKAREELNDVDCIVANHDLVLADLALGGGAILSPPEETIYIFDEGHHLPDKAINHFSSHTRYRSTIRWLGQSEGQWNNMTAPLADASHLMKLCEPIENTLKDVRTVMEGGTDLLQNLTFDVDRGQPSPRLRFEHGEAPEALEHLAKGLVEAFSELSRKLEVLYDELGALLEEDYTAVARVDLEEMYPVIGGWLARAEGNINLWASYTDTKLDKNWPLARWISVLEFNDISDFEIVSSPILASRALDQDLWSRCAGAVVTSATLTALNSFDRFRTRAGTYESARYATVPSPFNYAENAVLEIPDKAVEANNALQHTESVIEILPEIIDTAVGSLVLFASRRQMLDVYDALPEAMSALILLQGNESKQALIKKHKQRIDLQQGSVIFGLASFAEGVDLPGEYCVHVIIAKIPFSVPDDPIEAALSEWVESQGGNAFMQIAVPDAAVRIVQASGRLLRTEKDVGKVSILDRRLISKRYGSLILESLPPFKRNF